MFCWPVWNGGFDGTNVLLSSACSASGDKLDRLSLISCLRSANDSLSSSLEKTLRVCSTSLTPPRASSQSRTTSDSRVGVRSSSSVGTLPWKVIFPPWSAESRRQSSFALRREK